MTDWIIFSTLGAIVLSYTVSNYQNDFIHMIHLVVSVICVVVLCWYALTIN